MRYFPDVKIGAKYKVDLDGTHVQMEITDIKLSGWGQAFHPSISVNLTVNGELITQGMTLSNLEAWFLHGEWSDCTETEGRS